MQKQQQISHLLRGKQYQYRILPFYEMAQQLGDYLSEQADALSLVPLDSCKTRDGHDWQIAESRSPG